MWLLGKEELPNSELTELDKEILGLVGSEDEEGEMEDGEGEMEVEEGMMEVEEGTMEDDGKSAVVEEDAMDVDWNRPFFFVLICRNLSIPIT